MIGFLVGCTLPATDDGGKPETGATGDSGAAPEECPFDPAESDTECSECLDEKCSDLLPFCDEDPDCACMEQCLRQEGMGGVDACLESLGLAYRRCAKPTGR